MAPQQAILDQRLESKKRASRRESSRAF